MAASQPKLPREVARAVGDRLLEAAAKRFGQAEVYRVESESSPVSFEANRIKEASLRESSGVALRVISGSRVGFSSTTNPDAGEQLLDRVADAAPFGAEARFEFPAPGELPTVKAFDTRVGRLTFEELAEIGQVMIDSLKAEWPDLVCDAHLGTSHTTVKIANSAGLDLSFDRTSFSMWVGGTLIRGTDMLHVGEVFSASQFRDESKAVVESVLRQLENSRRLAPPPSGEVPVFLTPKGVVAVLLRPLLAGLDGRQIANGLSPLTGRLGERIVDGQITIRDDPTVPYAAGTRPFDDEGVPSAPVALIENGVLNSFVFDLQSAGLAGQRTTGSAQRGLASLPAPGVSAVDVAPGESSERDMLAGIKNGLVVEQLLGAGQGNELGGDFKANVLLGYRVENGRIVGRVKDTVISGNAYDALNRVEAVASEREWVYGSMQLPAIVCRGIEVAGK